MSDKSSVDTTKLILAEKIRDVCIEAAANGFKEAAMSGLCMDGAVEAAVGAMRSIDIKKIINQLE